MQKTKITSETIEVVWNLVDNEKVRLGELHESFVRLAHPLPKHYFVKYNEAHKALEAALNELRAVHKEQYSNDD